MEELHKASHFSLTVDLLLFLPSNKNCMSTQTEPPASQKDA